MQSVIAACCAAALALALYSAAAWAWLRAMFTALCEFADDSYEAASSAITNGCSTAADAVLGAVSSVRAWFA